MTAEQTTTGVPGFECLSAYIAKHGSAEGYICPICGGTGWVVHRNEDGYEVAEKCGCVELLRTRELIGRSGLKNQLESCTFESYQAVESWQKAVLLGAMDFAKNPYGRWFFIGGQVGSGKTHICAAIVGELLKAGKASRYMKWVDDVADLKRAVMDDEEYNRLMGFWKQTRVLYIDDLFKGGRKSPTEADVRIAFEILNHRYNNDEFITIVSSEYTTDGLLDIDEAVGSRIVQRSRGSCFDIGPDREKNYRLRRVKQ